MTWTEKDFKEMSDEEQLDFSAIMVGLGCAEPEELECYMKHTDMKGLYEVD